MKQQAQQQKEITARILSLSQQGKTMDAISSVMEIPLNEIQQIVTEASESSRILYVFMDRTVPATIIDVYGLFQKIKILNLTDELLSRAFGIRENPDWNDYENFLESRCMPRTRYGIKEELRELGLDSYDPFQIVEKTAGRVHGDGQWLRRMNRQWIAQYDSILKSAQNKAEARKQVLKLLAPNDIEETE